MNVYSHSKLSCFENCPKQFGYRYIEKVRLDTENVEAFLGKRVHEILERLYHHLRRHERPPSLAQVQERFERDWSTSWHENVRIVRQENTPEYYQALGGRCLENYYRSHYPFDRGETVAIEKHVTIQIDDAGHYRARGVIDRVVRATDGSYEIHDYKTGSSLPPRARLEQDRQLPLYQLGVEQSYPDVEQVKLVWHYLVFNKTVESRRTRSQLEALRRDLIGRIDEIEAADAYPSRPSPLCRWCEFNEICPEAARNTAAEEEAKVAPVSPDRGTQLSFLD